MLFVFKNSTNTEYIAADGGQAVELYAGSELTQTWFSDKKRICGINLVFEKQPAFDGYVTLEVIDKENGNTVRNVREKLSQTSDGILALSFDTLYIKSPAQFLFKISLEQTDEEPAGSITLKTNANYSGLWIDGKEKKCPKDNYMVL